MERETTGLYLSGHPMDAYRSQIQRVQASKMGAITGDFAQETGPERFHDNQKVRLAGVVTAAKTKTTRNDSLMAYVTLEDDTGSMELLVFSRTLSECGNYLTEGNAVIAEGKISVRDEKAPQLLCDRIHPLGEAGAPEPERELPRKGILREARKIYLRLPAMDHPAVKKIQQILILFPGNQQMVFYFADTGKRFGAPCLIHTSLIRELRELLGEENVVIK